MEGATIESETMQRVNDLWNSLNERCGVLDRSTMEAISVAEELERIFIEERTNVVLVGTPTPPEQEFYVGEEYHILYDSAVECRDSYTSWCEAFIRTKHSFAQHWNSKSDENLFMRDYNQRDFGCEQLLSSSRMNNDQYNAVAAVAAANRHEASNGIVEGCGGDTDGTEADIESAVTQCSKVRVKELFAKADEIGNSLRRSSGLAKHEMRVLRRLLPEILTEKQMQQYAEEYHELYTLTEETDYVCMEWSSHLYLAKFYFNLRCNESDCQYVDSQYYCTPCIGFVKFLGDALRRNTKVSDIHLEMEKLLGDDDDDDFNPLIAFVRTGSALRNVKIDGDVRSLTGQERELICLFFDAVAKNANIETLTYSGQVPATGLYNLLSTTQTLKTFVLECFDSEDDAPDNEAFKHTSFARNCTIEHFELKQGLVGSTLAKNILFQLHDGLSKLRRLTLSGEYDDALEHYLGHTKTLRHLELCHFSFDNDNVDWLLNGLHHHYFEMCEQTIVKLAFECCKFDELATDKFVKFMQTGVEGNKYHGAFGELEFVLREGSADSTFLGAIDSSSVFMSLLQKRSNADDGDATMPHVLCETIGSNFRSLSLLNCGSLQGFGDALASCTSNVHIECLRLSYIHSTEALKLANCLPQLVSVRELHLDLADINEYDSFQSIFLQSLRQNGSLCICSDPHVSARAYCKRNQYLKGMPFTTERGSPCQIELLPSLMRAANAISLLRSKYLLAGLMSAGESIGNIAVRVRPTSAV